jgi:hypothetical protein
MDEIVRKARNDRHYGGKRTMNSTVNESTRSFIVRFALALLGAALLASGLLGAEARSAKRSGAVQLERLQVSSFMSGDAQGGGIYSSAKAQGLVVANQTGKTSRKGARPMGIIAVLIALKADQKYALAFSSRRCAKGGGGILGRKIGFTASPQGEAVVNRKYLLKRNVLRRSKSVVLLSKETGKRFQSCGRTVVAAGDYNGDGIADGGD